MRLCRFYNISQWLNADKGEKVKNFQICADFILGVAVACVRNGDAKKVEIMRLVVGLSPCWGQFLYQTIPLTSTNSHS